MNMFTKNLIFMAGHLFPGPIAYVMVNETTKNSNMAAIVAVITVFALFGIYKRMGLYSNAKGECK